MPVRIDLTGQRFGRLVAERFIIGGRGAGSCMWDCTCDCGTTLLVSSPSLRKGFTRSCGCLRRETSTAMNYIDGRSTHPLYGLWASMVGRCRDKGHTSWLRYGGRGITVCDRWLKFTKFLEDMGERPSLEHSIDRIDNNGPYSPENCQWATVETQLLNRRTTRSLTYNGETKTHSAWQRELGLTPGTIFNRMKAFGQDAPPELLLSLERFPGRRGRGKKTVKPQELTTLFQTQQPQI